MQSDFDATPRFFAFPVSELARIGELVALYGSELPETPKDPDSPATRCIAGGLDREDSDDLRAMDYLTTASTTPLTDGRHASLGCWTHAILAAVASGDVIAEEITEAQLITLRPTFEL